MPRTYIRRNRATTTPDCAYNQSNVNAGDKFIKEGLDKPRTVLLSAANVVLLSKPGLSKVTSPSFLTYHELEKLGYVPFTGQEREVVVVQGRRFYADELDERLNELEEAN